jgi:hypothetical protein
MNRSRLLASLLVLVTASTAVIVACSSDESTTPAATNPSSTTTTVHVSAAAGGTVADPSGKTTLTIPAGALAADTDITLSLKPAANGAVVDISEFGPDGLTFLKPVTLAIKADAALAPQGKSLSVATLEGGAFKAVTGSTYAAGVATASISHFSSYSIVVIDGIAVLQPPASCTAALAGFKACGGDPTGTWTFADFCVPAQDIGSVQNCPEVTAAVDYTINRDVVIDGTTITSTAGTQKVVFTINYPLVCFTRDGDGGTYDAGINDCATVQSKFYKDPANPGVCTDNGSGVCKCVQSQEKAATASTDTYVTNGTTITTTKTDGTMSTSDYCVNGNLLTVQAAGKDGGVGGLYTLIRK